MGDDVPEGVRRIITELRQTVATLQAQVEEAKERDGEKAKPHAETKDEPLYQPPFQKLVSNEEEDAKIRAFFRNKSKGRHDLQGDPSGLRLHFGDSDLVGPISASLGSCKFVASRQGCGIPKIKVKKM